MAVASGVPAVSWEIALEAGAEAYTATLRQPGARATQVVVQIPRRVVDDTVLEAAELVLELGADGRIAAYAENAGMRSLASATLSELTAEAISPDTLAGEERPKGLARLEAELLQALELVRQARRCISE
ncbi:MAG: hypothetical protein AB7O44_23840 [Hyphomicrobiaceae bacterium]|jgi:hypothetical protein